MVRPPYVKSVLVCAAILAGATGYAGGSATQSGPLQILVTSLDRCSVDDLIKLAQTNIKEMNYAAALDVVDQILKLAPRNDYAVTVRQLVEDRAIIQEQRACRPVNLSTSQQEAATAANEGDNGD